MNIYLPHIHYTVRVRQIRRRPEGLANALAYVLHDNPNQCTLYLDRKKRIIPGDLAHELVHVLQFICLDRNISFTQEQEHMGYIMHYLMGRVLGHTWA